MILLLGVCAFITVTLAAIVVGRHLSAPRARLKARVEQVARGEYSPRVDYGGRRLLRMQNYSALPMLRGILQRSARAERIADDLDRAGVPLRVGEYLLMRVAAGLLTAIVVRLLVGPSPGGALLMLLGFLLGMIAPRWLVVLRIKRRRGQIEAQLPDALDMISRSLRAGGGLLASIEVVTEQMDGAIRDELNRTRQEIGAGLGVEDAFRDLDHRVQSKDLHIVVTAILIQREVGGNLAEILDNVASTMRQRIRVRNEMRAISSRQRLSAYLIASVPVVVVLALSIFARPVIEPLFEKDTGRVILAIAGVLELLGLASMIRLASSFEV